MSESKNGAAMIGGPGFEFRKPDERTKWESVKQAIYDPSSGQCLGRTGKSWGQLLLFYSLFYIVLAALFAICFQGLLATLDDKEPKWKLDDSLIGTNPGMGFRPISNRTEEGSLIWYNLRNSTTSQKWTELLSVFFKDYNKDQNGQNFESCSYDKSAGPGKVCQVLLEDFKKCGPPNYGYNTSSPCVFLKLNKIYAWKPKCFTTPQDDMPGALKEAISGTPMNEREKIWFSCEGEGPADKEHATRFEYFPAHGIPAYYFPFTNEDNYLSPVIAVQILNPEPSVVISIECRAWADNIHYRGGDLQREGSVHFEILRDDILNTTIVREKKQSM